MSLYQIAAPDLAPLAVGFTELHLLEGLGFSRDGKSLLVRATFTDSTDVGVVLHYGVWLYDLTTQQYTRCLNTELAGSAAEAQLLDIESASLVGSGNDLVILAETHLRGSGEESRLALIGTEGVDPNLLATLLGSDMEPRIERYSISQDGRFLALQTDSALLAPVDSPDANSSSDIYLLDLLTRRVDRVTFVGGSEVMQPAYLGNVITHDGKVQVAFATDAVFSTVDKNAAFSDPTAPYLRDAYLWSSAFDASGLIGSPTFRLASAIPQASVGNQASGFVDADSPILATPAGVFFSSGSADLVSSDTNDAQDAFLKPTTLATIRVALPGLGELDAGTSFLSASSSGRFSALLTNSPEVSGAPGVQQMVVVDLQDGTWNTSSMNGSTLANNDVVGGVIAPNGSAVAFTSLADNLAATAPVALGGSLFVATTGFDTNTVPTGSITVTGTAKQGEALTVTNTLADVDGLGTVSYQWKADGSAISGATNSTYTLTQTEVGKTITVTASYTDGQGTFESVTSVETGPVAASVESNPINIVYGSYGDDGLMGTEADDLLYGREGNDWLSGGAGDDTLLGGAGRDWFDGSGTGNDLIAGSVVRDRVNYTDYNGVDYTRLTSDLSVDLSGIMGDGSSGSGWASSAESGSDELRNINYVYAGSGNDSLQGSSALVQEVFMGGLGDDTIDGGAIAAGQPNNNRVVYMNAAAAVTVDLQAGTATGGDGNDTLRNITQVIGSAHDDLLRGSDNLNLTEYFEGQGGNDIIDGGSGFDVVRYLWNSKSSVVVDLMAGTASGSASGNDTLMNIEGAWGSDYGDTLSGTQGGDVLKGFNGEDFLNGRAGDDTLDGGDGDDWADYQQASGSVTVDLSAAVNQATGADGTDQLISIEHVRGGGYDDRLTGDAGDNMLRGGAGNDTLDGGPGTDWADYRNATGSVEADLSQSEATGADGTDLLISIENVRGSDYNDLLIGDAGDNWLRGRGGNDMIDGGEGSDWADYRDAGGSVYVDLYNGTTSGSSGSDILISIENLRGGNSDDVLSGDDFDNRLVGLAGNDNLNGNSGNDTIEGGDGNDRLDGGYGDDVLLGGAGRDWFEFDDDSNDTIDGGVIADRADYTDSNWIDASFISGSGLIVDMRGISGDGSQGWGTASYIGGGTTTFANINRVITGSLDDLIWGSSAHINEVFQGGLGDDTIDGGAIDPVAQDNNNRVHYSNAPFAVTVDLAAGIATGGDGTDTLININQALGSAYDDVLLGSDSVLAEHFEGMAGNDTIDGRGGHDIVRYSSASYGVVVDLASGSASGFFAGDLGTDTLLNIEGVVGSTYEDSLFGGAADETFQGYKGNDTIDGGGGIDRVDYTWSTSAVTVDLAAGTASDGFGGSDILRNLEIVRGSNFNDLVIGNAADNVLEGRAGDDALIGGAGNDTIFGGDGEADVALYSGNQADYRVTHQADGSLLVADLREAGEGTDILTGVEVLRFADGDLQSVATTVSTLSGLVYHWKSHALLDNVSLQISGADGDFSTQTVQGHFDFSGLTSEGYSLIASLEPGNSEGAVTVSDALAALRMVKGLNPNPDPDGTEPLTASELSPYQVMAADVDGDTRVTMADVEAILRMAVKAEGAMAPEWLFVEESRDFWDESSGLYTLTASSAGWDHSMQVTIGADLNQVNLVGVLKGDVNGSWEPATIGVTGSTGLY